MWYFYFLLSLFSEYFGFAVTRYFEEGRGRSMNKRSMRRKRRQWGERGGAWGKTTQPRAAAAEKRRSRNTEQAGASVYGSHAQTVLDGDFHERTGGAWRAVLLLLLFSFLAVRSSALLYSPPAVTRLTVYRRFEILVQGVGTSESDRAFLSTWPLCVLRLLIILTYLKNALHLKLRYYIEDWFTQSFSSSAI